MRHGQPLPAAVCNPLDGTITVTVTATDVLGNVGTGTATIIADNTKPTRAHELPGNAGTQEGQPELG